MCVGVEAGSGWGAPQPPPPGLRVAWQGSCLTLELGHRDSAPGETWMWFLGFDQSLKVSQEAEQCPSCREGSGQKTWLLAKWAKAGVGGGMPALSSNPPKPLQAAPVKALITLALYLLKGPKSSKCVARR
jgi:hypothetical protein